MTARTSDPAPLERREAWGMATEAVCHVVRPRSAADVLEAFALARGRGWTVAAWGNGRSYGDAALNDSQLLLDFGDMHRVLAFDRETGVITVEPGLTLRALWQRVLPDGFWPPVVSGTMFTTIGGLVAANAHGKNNWKYGPIGEHVLGFTIVTPDGAVREVTRETDPDLFHGAIAGFGWLGCFVSITLKLKRVHSGRLRVTPFACEDLDAMFRTFERCNEAGFDYVVGWIDAFAGGASLGRGQIHAARYVAEGEDPEGRPLVHPEDQELPARMMGVMPMSWIHRIARPFVTRLGMRAINLLRYHWMASFERNRHTHLLEHARFNFLLDFVPDWKKVYLPGGLVQIQLFLPKERARDAARRAFELGREIGLEPWLVVMKRHRPDPFWLTHAVDGYSFAMDFPVTDLRREELHALARRLERLVVDAGGRFYFAKDSMVSGEAVLRAWGEETWRRFFALKARVDPEGLLQSNQFRRVLGELWPRLAPEPAAAPAPAEAETLPLS